MNVTQQLTLQKVSPFTLSKTVRIDGNNQYVHFEYTCLGAC